MSFFNTSTLEVSRDPVHRLFDLKYHIDSSVLSEQSLQEKRAYDLLTKILKSVDSSTFAGNVQDSSVGLTLNQYSLHEVSPDNRTGFSSKIESDKTLADKKRMIAIIQSCYFEAGAWTEADSFFESLRFYNNSIDVPLRILSDIVNHSLADDHILEGALHILSNYSYEEITPYGITMAIACAVNHSPVIQDLLIACFEKWNSQDSISILESLELDETWLKEYRDEVVEQIKSSDVSA